MAPANGGRDRHIEEHAENNVIGISNKDFDGSVFRIYKKKWFLKLLTDRVDALMRVSMWHDPFENFFLSRTQVELEDGETGDLSGLAEKWHGQCWSGIGDTDAMWRIYSSDGIDDDAGIQVEASLRSLFGNLWEVNASNPELCVFLGKVAYHEKSEIEQLMQQLSLLDLTNGGQGTGFAKLLCIKRTAFSHESETRLL